ncbi:adenylate/guanylate cyclase domain-containing protein [Clostridium grantii]|uniref:Adenylate and Guanylate cyclase catalytic domain-containing protein n=1 Tax=Clostridium grantii DSM 8605 TaxID=1121316 RepID=A0A1M5R0F9_9CLOT|nr:adenylate/guanylate cyclase domain-containing protein [Clostridium grantii]SHH19842.1 Adenylate and Guanylate cyclase catalytic domain-containing protein [Clostridium grantii DSM 8605]
MDNFNNFEFDLMNCSETEINKRYGEEKAILLIDCTEFTNNTTRDGIIKSLQSVLLIKKLIKSMQSEYSAVIIKQIGDSFMLIFDEVDYSIDFGQILIEEVKHSNIKTKVKIGIGYGFILNNDNEDIFGEQVNFASKLGEELAEESEMLITRNAFRKSKYYYDALESRLYKNIEYYKLKE